MPSPFVTPRRTGLGARIFNFPVSNLARHYFHKRLTVFDTNSSETGGGGEKTTEISLDCRPEIQNFLHRVEARSTERLQETIRGHRARVPVPRLNFVARISHD